MLVSIILPYFKKEKFIAASVNSILKQKLKNFELLIINDEPGKKSSLILNKLKKSDKRIKIIQNKFNIGAGLSRNKAIKIAKGEFIAFIDADDIWKKNKLSYQIKIMKKFNYNISHTAYDIINENNKKICTRFSRNLDYQKLLNSCDVGLSTLVLKKDLLKGKNLFSNFKTKEDYYLWLKLAKSGYILYYINISLSKWRKSKNALSSSTLQKLADSYRVYYKYDKNLITPVFRTIILSLNFIKKKIYDYRN